MRPYDPLKKSQARHERSVRACLALSSLTEVAGAAAEESDFGLESVVASRAGEARRVGAEDRERVSRHAALTRKQTLGKLLQGS